MSPMEKALANGEFAYQGSRWRDRYAPIGALGVGVLITVVVWINHVDAIGAGLARAGLVVLIQMVLGVPVALAAAGGTSQLLDASFGATRDAVIKIAAVAIGLGGLVAVPRVAAMLLSIPFFKDELFPAVL